MQIPLYELILDDYSRYYGGDITNPLWRESPDKAIYHFKLRLPNGDFLLLEGYEEYNFFIEAIANIWGAKGTYLTYLFLMGCKNGTVTSYRVALNNQGHRIGDITMRQFPKGQEYDGKPTTGWHRGLKQGG